MAEVSNPHTDQVWPESRWRQAGRKFLASGVLEGADNELAVSDGGALDVAVDTGRAFVDGMQYVLTASTTVTLDAADPSNDRIDLVVLEYDPDGAAAGQGTVRLGKVTGTPAASPSAPSPTQADAGVFQYVLAEVTVPGGSSSLGTITDRRDLIDVPGFDYSSAPSDGELWRFDADTGFFVPTGGLVRVAETTLASAAAEVTFSDIPQIYDDLHLRIWAAVEAGGTTASVDLTFNNDTGNNYKYQLLDVDTSTVSASQASATRIQPGSVPNTADQRAGHLLDIFGYADTDHDTAVYARGAGHDGTDPVMLFSSWRWDSNAAVTEIDLVLSNAENFDAGSEFVLYGRL